MMAVLFVCTPAEALTYSLPQKQSSFIDIGSTSATCNVYPVRPGQSITVYFSYNGDDAPFYDASTSLWRINKQGSEAYVAFCAKCAGNPNASSLADLIAQEGWAPSVDKSVADNSKGGFAKRSQAYTAFMAGFNLHFKVPSGMHFLVTWGETYGEGGGTAYATSAAAALSKTSGKAAGIAYKVTSVAASGGTVKVTGAAKKSAKKVTIPPSVKIDGITFKVTKIAKKAFKKSKAKKLIVKTRKLTKKSVKGSLKGSKVKTVKVKVGKKKLNKKYAKKYRKAFSKKNCGKKVKVTA
ncbi:MAG: hypothetical protein ACOX69_04970 [Coriobacteriales bacterium]